MLVTLGLGLLVCASPQGKVVLVSQLEAQGATTGQATTVRDAVLAELKAQGYDARAQELGQPPDAAGTVGGAVVVVKGTFEITLRLKELGSTAILAVSTVRCGSADRLSEAAKEAASQLAREGRSQWGVRTRFKPPR